jgi:membrane-associated protease RseP (regulator of RpoE activity)
MLVLYIILIYWFIIIFLDKRGILERYNISAFGPILMIKTTRGDRLLRRLSEGELRKGFWRSYANIGTIFVFIAMIFMFILVVVMSDLYLTVQPEPTALHKPRNILLLPVINEFIPLCALIGFVIALIVHELSHAVLSTVEGIKVKSMGLLVALVPIGAFAEPDSEQLFGGEVKKGQEKDEPNKELKAGKEKKKVATARERTRILSAGVTSNFVVAFIAFLLFFSIISAIQPVSEGMAILGVEDGFPAANGGIKAGMTIIKMDNEPIGGYMDFFAFMNNTTPGQVVEVQTKDEKFIVELDRHPLGDKGFLGIIPFNAKAYLENLRSIPSLFTTPSPLKWLAGVEILMSMPFLALLSGGSSTFNPSLSHLYEPVGAASFLGGGIFVIADVILWIGWINFYVGLFNCLPMVPLDGGYVFREMLNSVLRRGIKQEKKREMISKAITYAIAILVFSTFVIMVAGPYLFPVIGVSGVIAVVVLIAAALAALAYRIAVSEQKVPNAVLIIEGANANYDKLKISHHGGDTIIDAFGNPETGGGRGQFAGDWNYLEVRQNGEPCTLSNKSRLNGDVRWNPGPNRYTRFAPGDELEISGLSLNAGDSIEILYTQTGDVLLQTTVT